MISFLRFLLWSALGGALLSAHARAVPAWRSLALEREVDVQLLEPTRPQKGALPLIVYLRGLAAPRAGTEADETIVADIRAEGFLVAVLDYGHDPRARWPRLNRDLVELRRQLHQKSWLEGRNIDPAGIYILPSGHRLRRGVEFFSDDGRRLALDILYPSRPYKPVGAVLEFSCDNQNRMGNFSLQFCTDSLLEGLATEGLLVAMADHPVAAPYKGIDAFPDAPRKVLAAVRTLRAEATSLGGDGRIITLGFSRGSGMALLAVTAAGRAEWNDLGAHPGAPAAVQGAIVLSGRFTYLDLLSSDPMIPRYEKVWGTREEKPEVWGEHSTLQYLREPTVPLFLSINATESPEALHQMDVLRRRLTRMGSPFVYAPEWEPRGHRMPLDAQVLNELRNYVVSIFSVTPSGGVTSEPKPSRP